MTQLYKLIGERKGDAHLHTNWTDGVDTIEEMIKSGTSLNLDWILFSEHNRKNSEYSYSSFFFNIKKFSNSYPNIKLFCGAECKILDLDGNIDISSEALNFAELITGVVHRFPNEIGNIMNSKNKIYSKEEKDNALSLEKELSISGIRKGKFSILGHPLGMTIRRFKLIPELNHFVDLINECKNHNVIFELNLRYHFPIIDKLMHELILSGVDWTIGSNSHSSKEMKNLWKKYYSHTSQ